MTKPKTRLNMVVLNTNSFSHQLNSPKISERRYKTYFYWLNQTFAGFMLQLVLKAGYCLVAGQLIYQPAAIWLGFTSSGWIQHVTKKIVFRRWKISPNTTFPPEHKEVVHRKLYVALLSKTKTYCLSFVPYLFPN